jgi:hypothetical protein
MRGIPEKYKTEVNDLIWKFLWDNKPNQIERNVCCLNINEGGMGMINIDNFVISGFPNLSAAFHFIYNFFPNVISVYIVPVKNT